MSKDKLLITTRSVHININYLDPYPSTTALAVTNSTMKYIVNAIYATDSYPPDESSFKGPIPDCIMPPDLPVLSGTTNRLSTQLLSDLIAAGASLGYSSETLSWKVSLSEFNNLLGKPF